MYWQDKSGKKQNMRGENSSNKVMTKVIRAFMLKTSAILALVLVLSLPAAAGDWPARLYDIRRGGITSEQLQPPLSEAWTYATSRVASPAWTESPAIHDYYHLWYDLKPRQNFAPCFDVAVVGNLLYFGSSASGAVTCLDANSSSEVWTFFTDGPIRFAPHVADGRVFVGSDDGYVYCLNAADGSLIWSERAGPTDEMVWGNEHMISVWPVRSSVLVVGSDVFWTAGIFPEEGMYICKRIAADGTGGWTNSAPSLPPQGYLLATPSLLIVPTGKTYPTVYNRSNGAYVGYFRNSSRDGGCWALLTPDENHFWSGPTTTNATQQFDAGTRAYIASVSAANYLIAGPTYAYYNTDTQIYKINRSDRSVVWSVSYAYPYALIKAGDTLFAGGDGEIAAFNDSGTRIWTAPVDGKAYGLAVANSFLYASTEDGSIHCFSATLPGVTNNGGASNVTTISADLNGYLTSTGEDATASVSVFWGTSDGGTNEFGWDDSNDLGTNTVGPLVTNITGLSSPDTYYYRFRATNSYGDSWATSTSVFITGEVTIQATDDSASEEGPDTGTFTVYRPAGAKDEALTASYTVDGTADSGDDYEPLSGTVTMAAGVANATITVTPIWDAITGEPNETVVVTLTQGPYIIGSPNNATVTISDGPPLNPHLVAYWNFDNDMTNIQGNSDFDGTEVGNAVVSSDDVKVGSGALKIDDDGASTNYVDITSDLLSVGNTAVVNTVVAWYKYSDISIDGSDVRNFIWETSPNYTLSFAIRDEGADKRAQWFYLGTSNQSSVSSTGPIATDGQWHHVAMVWNKTANYIKYYHDGVSSGPITITAGNLQTQDGFHIGNHRTGNGARNWDGYIDDVAVFDEELSASDITYLAAGNPAIGIN